MRRKPGGGLKTSGMSYVRSESMEEIASKVLLGEDDMEEAAPPALSKGRDLPSQFPWLQVGGVPTAVWEKGYPFPYPRERECRSGVYTAWELRSNSVK